MSEKTLSSDNPKGTNLNPPSEGLTVNPSTTPQGTLSHSGQNTSSHYSYEAELEDEEDWSEEPPDGADGRGKMVKTAHGVRDTKGGNGAGGSGSSK